jgi:hypothetical protein
VSVLRQAQDGTLAGLRALFAQRSDRFALAVLRSGASA